MTGSSLNRQLKAFQRALVDAIPRTLEVEMMNELAVRVHLALGLRSLLLARRRFVFFLCFRVSLFGRRLGA